MSVSLYMDENVEGAITDGLRRRGVDVLTVQERKAVSERRLTLKYWIVLPI